MNKYGKNSIEGSWMQALVHVCAHICNLLTYLFNKKKLSERKCNKNASNKKEVHVKKE